MHRADHALACLEVKTKQVTRTHIPKPQEQSIPQTNTQTNRTANGATTAYTVEAAVAAPTIQDRSLLL